MTDKKIVANTSKAYGYNYASLGDIALQGFKIPKMKTGTENLKEYVYYYDEEIKEWIRGAEIVVPENIVSRDGKKQNEFCPTLWVCIDICKKIHNFNGFIPSMR